MAVPDSPLLSLLKKPLSQLTCEEGSFLGHLLGEKWGMPEGFETSWLKVEAVMLEAIRILPVTVGIEPE